MSEWEDGNWSGMKDLQLLVSLLRKLLSNSALSSLEFALVIGNEFREAKLATNAKRSQTRASPLRRDPVTRKRPGQYLNLAALSRIRPI